MLKQGERAMLTHYCLTNQTVQFFLFIPVFQKGKTTLFDFKNRIIYSLAEEFISSARYNSDSGSFSLALPLAERPPPCGGGVCVFLWDVRYAVSSDRRERK